MLNYLASVFMVGGTLTFVVLLLLPVLFLVGVSGVYFLADTFRRYRSRRRMF